MSATNNGGPAFPVDQSVASAWAVFEHSNKPLSDKAYSELLSKLQSGMTLRDYFAAKAMQGYFTDPNAGFSSDAIQQGAQAAYRIADAMLKAREA